MAGGCSMREGPAERRSIPGGAGANHGGERGGLTGNTTSMHSDDGLAVFTWGRGEDGQLGLGDTADQDEPTYVRIF